MNQNILSALAAKSAKLNQERQAASVKPEQPKAVQPKPLIIGRPIPQHVGTQSKPVLATVTDSALDNSVVRVEIRHILNKDMFEIWFSDAPSRDIRSELKGFGFWYQPDSMLWTHKDTEETRLFLNRVFDAGLELSPAKATLSIAPDSPVLSQSQASDSQITVQDEIQEALGHDIVPEFMASVTYSEYQQYCERVDILCRQFNCSCSVLPILAVEALWNQTFKN